MRGRCCVQPAAARLRSTCFGEPTSNASCGLHSIAAAVCPGRAINYDAMPPAGTRDGVHVLVDDSMGKLQ